MCCRPGVGQWVFVLDGVLTALGSSPGKKWLMARMKKWLKVGSEFGHDRPEERSGWARKKKWIFQEDELDRPRK